MKTLPTAEEFIEQTYSFIPFELDQITELMQEFAKLHVQAALDMAYQRAEVYNKAKFPGDVNYQVEPESILNAYPLENIK